MSAPNFYNKNASKIFASECQEEFDYEDLIMNIQSELKGADEIEESDNERSYPATKFAKFEIEQGKWLATLYLTIRSGYFSGVNLDWEVEIEDINEGSSFEMGEDKIPASLQARIESKTRQIEKVYANYTTPLICLAVFSNGEAIYEKCK